MEEAEFLIPHSIDELLEFADKQYSVQDVSEPVQIREQYTGLRLTLCEDLDDFIFGKFDLLYSCIKNFPLLSPKVTREVWELSIKAFGLQNAALKPILAKGNVDDAIREKLLRNTKMIFYICTELMYKFEEKSMSEKETTLKPGKGKKKPDKQEWEWDDEKSIAINELFRLVSLDLKNLWKKPNISDDFLDQMSRICLKLLEDRQIGFASKSSMRNSIFQILSVLCKEFIFGLSLIPRLLQLLMLHEHLAAPLASSISNLEENDGNAGLLQLILTEVSGESEITPKAGSNFASFIVGLSVENPKSLARHLELLTDIVETEPYTLRCGILEAAKNLIMSIYSGNDLTENQKGEKHMLFEMLENHLLDVNAYCRCRAIQAWTTLVKSEILPVKLLLHIIEQIIENTLDKSSYCRKDAIKFMKACLEHNPFSGNLDRERMKNQIESATKKLKNLENLSGKVDLDVDDVWETVEKELQAIIAGKLAKELTNPTKGKKVIEDHENADGEKDMEVDEDENKEEEDEGDKEKEAEPELGRKEKEVLLQEGLIKVANMLVENNLNDAVDLAFELTKKYDVQNVFGLVAEEEPDEDDDIDSIIMTKTDYMCTLLKASLMALKPNNSAPDEDGTANDEIKRQKDIVRFLKNCLFFSEQVHLASNNVLKILLTSQTADLVEAIDFIASAQQFGLLSEEDSILKLMEFLHSKDMALKKAVSDACKRIYLSSIDTSQGAHVSHESFVEAMKKVCGLVHNSHPNFKNSIALLISSWVDEGYIDNECIFTLWELVESRNKAECVPALHLLSIALVSKPVMVQEQVPTLDRIGFGSRGEGCFELAKWAAEVLTLVTPKTTIEMMTNPFRMPIDDVIYSHMSNILIKGLFKLSDVHYCSMSDSIVKAIFKTCKKPVRLLHQIMKKLNEELIKYNPADHPDNEMADPTSADIRPLTQLATQEPESQIPESQRTDSALSGVEKTPHVILLRYVHVIGQVAEELHTFMYTDVMAEIRRQKNLIDLEKERRRNNRLSRQRNSMASTADEEDDVAFFDVQKLLRGSNKQFVSNTEEENLDRLLRINDTEVIENELGKLLPFIQECFSSNHCSHHGLRVTAIKSYGKFLKLSPNICTVHIRKFVTMLAKSKDIRVKVTCIQTLADLLKKYPNQCEPYSPFLYDCLKDKDITVRFEALVVISKLILSDMVRVKFQISSLAQCLTDEDKKCRDVAQYFFATLATKGNILYNLVLDMMSHLSAEYSESNQQQFETIMKVILPHIDKEKQVVALIEKLCSRFKDKAEEIECYNLALCIVNLPISSKSIKAVKDSIECYAEKLKYPTVKKQFDELVANARKQVKMEGKDSYDQWQELLDSCANDKDAAKQAIANLAENNEEEEVEKKEKRKAKKKPPPKKKGKAASDSDDDFNTEKTPRKQRGRKKVIDSDEDEPVLQTAVRNKRQPPRKLASRNEAIEEDDEDEEMESPVKQSQRRGRKNSENDSEDELFSSKTKKTARARSGGRSTRSSIRL